jgi:hypothetical protein
MNTRYLAIECLLFFLIWDLLDNLVDLLPSRYIFVEHVLEDARIIYTSDPLLMIYAFLILFFVLWLVKKTKLLNPKKA